MPQKVFIQDRGLAVEFPDSWTPDQIETSINKRMNPVVLEQRRLQESKAKDTWDAFALASTELFQKGKEAFMEALPAYIFAPPEMEPHPRFKGMYRKTKPGIGMEEFWEQLAHPKAGQDPLAGIMVRGLASMAPERIYSEREVEQMRVRGENAMAYFRSLKERSRQSYERWVSEHPELAPREEYTGHVRELVKKNPSLLADPGFWAYKAAEIAPFTVAIMGATMAGAFATKDPTKGMLIGAAVSGPPIAQDLFEDLKANGATDRQAADLTALFTPPIALTEVAGELGLLTSISPSFKKKFMGNMVKNVAKRSMSQMAVEATGQFAKGYVVSVTPEIAEEIVQQAMQDAAVKTVNDNRKVLENWKDIIADTFVAVAPFGLTGGGGRARQAWQEMGEYNTRRPMTREQFTTTLRLKESELIGKEKEGTLTPKEQSELNALNAARDEDGKIDFNMAQAIYGVRVIEDISKPDAVREMPPTPYQFRSRIEEEVDALPQEKFTAEQLIGMLKKRGVSDLEIDWIVGDMLWDPDTDAPMQSVKKQDVLDAIRVKKFLVEDYEYGSDPDMGDQSERDELYSNYEYYKQEVEDYEAERLSREETFDEIASNLDTARTELEDLQEELDAQLADEEITQEEYDEQLQEKQDEVDELETDLQDARDAMDEAERNRDEAQEQADDYYQQYEDFEVPEQEEQGKYESYSLRIGWDYREILLRLGDVYGEFMPEGHWAGSNSDNTFVHLRFATSEDSEGRRLTIVSEVQSDWNIELQQEGERGDFYEVRWMVPDAVEKKPVQHTRRFRSKIMAAKQKTDLAARNIESEVVPISAGGRVEPLPLKGIFADVGMRWLVMNAVQNGQEAVTWITGHETRGFYRSALSQQVSRITYEKNADGTFKVIPYDQSGDVINIDRRMADAAKRFDYNRMSRRQLITFYGQYIADIIINDKAKAKELYSGALRGFTKPKVAKIPKPPMSEQELEDVWYSKQRGTKETLAKWEKEYGDPLLEAWWNYYKSDYRYRITAVNNKGERITARIGRSQSDLKRYIRQARLPEKMVTGEDLKIGGEWATRLYGDFEEDIRADYPNRPDMLKFAYEREDASRLSIIAKNYIRRYGGKIENISVDMRQKEAINIPRLRLLGTNGIPVGNYARVGGEREDYSIRETIVEQDGDKSRAATVYYLGDEAIRFTQFEHEDYLALAQRYIDMQVRAGSENKDYSIRRTRTNAGGTLYSVVYNNETIAAFTSDLDAKAFIENEKAAYSPRTALFRGFYIPEKLAKRVSEFGEYLAQAREDANFANSQPNDEDVAYNGPSEKQKAYAEFVKKYGRVSQYRRKISEQLRNQGFIDMRGTEITTPQEAADVASMFRDPTVEQFQIIYIDNSTKKVIAHSVETIGHPGAFYNKGVTNNVTKILERYLKRGIDVSFYMVHNHPTGNPQPSSADVGVSLAVRRLFGTRFNGQLVIDSDHFYYLDDLNRRSVPMSYPTGAKVAWPRGEDVHDLVKRGQIPTDKNHWTVLFYGADNKLLGVNRISADSKNQWQFIKENQRAFKAQFYMIVTEGPILSLLDVVNNRVEGFLDMVQIDEDGDIIQNWRQNYFPGDNKGFEEFVTQGYDLPPERQAFPLKSGAKYLRVQEPRVDLSQTKVVDENGKPKVLYSGHMNVSLYGKFDPNRATAGGFYATADPTIASNYAMSKMGVMEYYEGGSQYVLSQGKQRRKIWTYRLTREQVETLKALELDESEDSDGYELNQYRYWRHSNKDFDKDARAAFYNPYNLVNIWKFLEYAGYNIAYNDEAAFRTPEGEVIGDGSFADYLSRKLKDFDWEKYRKDEYKQYRDEFDKKRAVAEAIPIYERQRKNAFERILDRLGIRWESYEQHRPGVMAIYLDIRNPIVISYSPSADTITGQKAKSNLTPEVMEDLEKAAEREPEREYADPYADKWTKDFPLKPFIQLVKEGDPYWATQIPTKAKEIFKKHGFDGVQDYGGKSGGTPHEVWVAFDTKQIISAYDPGVVREDGAWQPEENWEDREDVSGDDIINEADKTEGAEAEVKKSKLIRMRDTTLAKMKTKKLQEGIRKGGVLSRAEVQRVQGEVKKMLQGLDFEGKGRMLALVTQQLTQAQLERHLSDIQERLQKTVEKTKIDAYVKAIRRLRKVQNIPPDYREQIDAILEDYDLKRRTKKTKERRRKLSEFMEQLRQSGDVQGIPDSIFVDLGKKTLDEMDYQEVRQLHDVLKMLVHIGQLKSKLIARKEQRELEAEVSNLVERIYDRTNTTEDMSQEDILDTLSKLEKDKEMSRAQKFWKLLKGVWYQHIKIEHNSITYGIHDLFLRVHEGVDRRKNLAEKYYGKLDALLRSLGDYTKKMTETVKFEFEPHMGFPQQRTWLATRQQMLGVALNSGNEGNRDRLRRGYGLSDENIDEIVSRLTPTERAFVEGIWNLFDELFPEMNETTKGLLGISVKKVEGRYFPIVNDYELSKMRQFREASIDLFQSVFQTAYINRSFTKERIGGSEPVDLNIFGVITQHVDNVILYTALAQPIRDAQKIINHPRFQKAIVATQGEDMYNEYRRWLVDTANPRTNAPKDPAGKLMAFFRHASTAAILGLKLVVSAVQALSITQTIHVINRKFGNQSGVGHTSKAAIEYLMNRESVRDFIYQSSVEMRQRRTNYDREVRDFVERSRNAKMLKGKGINPRDWDTVLFSLITLIDEQTTITSWLAAYNSIFDIRKGNEAEAIEFADSLVRTTQPAGEAINLPSIMRGGIWMKNFTMFMTHFSNYHNLLVMEMDRLKYSKEHPFRKIGNFADAVFWLIMAPSAAATFIRGGGEPPDEDNWTQYLTDMVIYSFSGLFLVRDLVNSMLKGFDFGKSPALASGEYLVYTVRGKDWQKKAVNTAKFVSIVTGKVPIQVITSIDGLIDLLQEETDDWRRLVYSEYQLGTTSKKLKRFSP